jgi:hypothetical protein
LAALIIPAVLSATAAVVGVIATPSMASAVAPDPATKQAADSHPEAGPAATAPERAAEARDTAPLQPPGSAEELSPKPLSVAPLDQIQYPEDRPAWIDAENDLRGQTHRWVVTTSPCETRAQAAGELERVLPVAVQLYAERLVRDSEGCRDVELGDAAQLARDAIARRYDGTVEQGDVTLYESAAELEFPRGVQAEIRRRCLNAEVRGRLGALGLFVGGGLACLILGSVMVNGCCRHADRRARRRASSD